MKRRALGQHYLADKTVIKRIVTAAAINPDERILEIGTGRGALTSELASLGSALEGYEVDRENFEKTLEIVRGTGAVIRLGDAFKERPRFDVLVASLPYSRSAEFVQWICQLDYDRAVVVLQEDFVKKVTSKPGTRDYRGVSAIAQIASELVVLDRVSRNAFSPPPKVGSVIALIKPRKKMSKEETTNVKRLFSLRRREVASALKELEFDGGGRDFGRRRVFQLSPEEVHALSSTIPSK